MSLKSDIGDGFLTFATSYIAPPLLKTIRWSTKIQTRNSHFHEEVARDSNYILCFWHGQIVPLMYYFLNSGFYTFVSPHRDGRYVANVMEGMGQNSIKTSLRDPRIGELRRAFRLARDGKTLGITPDGPLGPRFTVQPGVIKISERTKLPLLPVGGLATRAHFFPSWDRFCFPLPFSKIIINFGPVYRPWESTEKLSVKVQKFENQMVELSRQLTTDCAVPPEYFSSSGET